MEVTGIPFVAHVGIERCEDGELSLPFTAAVRNHLATVHASAQFALAETASGDCLQRRFPDLGERVVAVLRDAQVKFKRPARSRVRASADIEPDPALRFRQEFDRRGRAIVTVEVALRDELGAVTCVGSYRWFVQAI